MTTLREAAQQALEALEKEPADFSEWLSTMRAARTALRAALAEPEHKPDCALLKIPSRDCDCVEPVQESAVAETATTQQPVEQTPPSEYRRGYWDGFAIGKREGRIEAEDALAEPEQEPVCDKDPRGCYSVRCQLGEVCKNTAPPQRKPLTDEEIALIVAECSASAYRHDDFSFARAVEKAHGIGGEE